MRLSVFELSGRRSVLAGSAEGRNLLAALVAHTPSADAPEVLYLDFEGVEIATSSFLRESVVGYRNFARTARQNIYPVVANANAAVAEELQFFAEQRADAFWSCDLDQADQVSNARVIGQLDAAQRATFEAVVTLGIASATQLQTTIDDKIGPTAWNNRLATLVAKGLLLEARSGKAKTFRPLVGDA